MAINLKIFLHTHTPKSQYQSLKLAHKHVRESLPKKKRYCGIYHYTSARYGKPTCTYTWVTDTHTYKTDTCTRRTIKKNQNATTESINRLTYVRRHGGKRVRRVLIESRDSETRFEVGSDDEGRFEGCWATGGSWSEGMVCVLFRWCFGGVLWGESSRRIANGRRVLDNDKTNFLVSQHRREHAQFGLRYAYNLVVRSHRTNGKLRFNNFRDLWLWK